MKVMIVQPFVPEYRVPLFRGLMQYKEMQIRVHCDVCPFDNEAKKYASEGWLYANHEIKSYFKERLAWQVNLSIPQNFVRGDVIVISGNPRFISNLMLLWKARRKKLGIVMWSHGWTAGAYRINAYIRRQILRLADIILLYTDKEVEEFVLMGFPADKLRATNNTVDTAYIEKCAKVWDEDALSKFRIEKELDGKDIMLFCGRLTKKARLDVAVKALSRLGDKTRLVVIGDGEEKQKLHSLASHLGVSNRILWVGKQYDQMMLAPWFMSSHLFVYPGSIGLSIVHAMAYGLPVITHNNMRNQMPEVWALSDGVNGFFYKEGNYADLALKVKAGFVENSNGALSINAKHTIEDKFSMYKMVDRFQGAVLAASNASLSLK